MTFGFRSYLAFWIGGAGTGFVPSSERTATVEAENRVTAVPAENRVITVPSEQS